MHLSGNPTPMRIAMFVGVLEVEKPKGKKMSGAYSSAVDPDVQPCESYRDVPASSSAEVICEIDMAARTSTLDLSKEQLQARATPLYTFSKPLKSVRMRNYLPAFLYGICDDVADQFVESSCCQKLFCTSCVMQALKNSAICGYCQAVVTASIYTTPHPLLASALDYIEASCDFVSSTALVG